MKFTGPKVKLSRSLGIALTPKAARYMEKRPYPPGQHGPGKKAERKSVYGKQLIEKQRLRFQYNISERQMRNYFRKASRKKGNINDILIQLLETRLDAFVYRTGFARTIYAARQYVNHGHVLVNGKRVDIPSYQLKVGDVVTVREDVWQKPHFQGAMEMSPSSVGYIDRDFPNRASHLAMLPVREDIPVICDVTQVIEYYSK